MNPSLTIRLFHGDAEASAAAHLMCDSEPWITLGRKFEHTIKAVTNPASEVYVAIENDQVIGLVLLCLPIPLIKGYIGALAVHADHRNRGIGSQLLAFAEEKIFKLSPNVFLTVTSFNPAAQRFYLRHGYTKVGDLTNFTIPGHDEILLRKTIGPWSAFTPT